MAASSYAQLSTFMYNHILPSSPPQKLSRFCLIPQQHPRRGRALYFPSTSFHLQAQPFIHPLRSFLHLHHRSHSGFHLRFFFSPQFLRLRSLMLSPIPHSPDSSSWPEITTACGHLRCAPLPNRSNHSRETTSAPSDR